MCKVERPAGLAIHIANKWFRTLTKYLDKSDWEDIRQIGFLNAIIYGSINDIRRGICRDIRTYFKHKGYYGTQRGQKKQNGKIIKKPTAMIIQRHIYVDPRYLSNMQILRDLAGDGFVAIYDKKEGN